MIFLWKRSSMSLPIFLRFSRDSNATKRHGCPLRPALGEGEGRRYHSTKIHCRRDGPCWHHRHKCNAFHCQSELLILTMGALWSLSSEDVLSSPPKNGCKSTISTILTPFIAISFCAKTLQPTWWTMLTPALSPIRKQRDRSALPRSWARPPYEHNHVMSPKQSLHGMGYRYSGEDLQST